METTLQTAAICVLAAILALVLKKDGPQMALLLTLAAAAAAFLCLLRQLGEILNFLEEISGTAGVRQELMAPLYKTIGIALVVRLGGNLCRDAGESALASVIETAGTVCALLVSLPLLRMVLAALMELMKG